MKRSRAFLAFDGNCREAMTFYRQCFGAHPFPIACAEAPLETPKQAAGRIQHSTPTKGPTVPG